ncbi:MAG: hypothetical protein OCD01_03905 [Fibrobacterales bacterium]
MSKNVHMDAQDLLKMVQLQPGSLGKYAVVPGPIDRLDAVKAKLTDPIRDFSFAGVEMYTGEIGELLVSTANSGMYAPPAAITTEIFAAGGSETIIRTGSCGAMREDIAVGDIIIANGAIRGEGTSPYYVPSNFSTVVDLMTTSALVEACENLGVTYHVGLTWSTDALLRETKELIAEMCDLKCIGVDMVTSALLTVAQVKGLKAGAVLAVSDNLITGELGFGSLKFFEAETKTIDIAFEAINILESKGAHGISTSGLVGATTA